MKTKKKRRTQMELSVRRPYGQMKKCSTMCSAKPAVELTWQALNNDFAVEGEHILLSLQRLTLVSP